MGGDTRAQLARMSPVILAAVGALGSGALFWVLRSSETERIRGGFEQIATERLSAVHRRLLVALEPVSSTVALFDSSDFVEPGEFRTFTSHCLQRVRAMRAIAWMESASDGGERALNVRYAEGPEAAALGRGKDTVLSEGELARVLANTKRGQVLISPAPIPSEQSMLLALVPVISDGVPGGYVAGLFDVGLLIADTEGGVDLPLIVEDHTEDPPRLLVGDATEGDRIREQPIHVGGRDLVMACVVPQGLIGERRGWIPWWFLIIGLVATGLLVATVASVTSRARIQGLVERRTKEVRAAYDTLAEEAMERVQAVSHTQLVERRLREIIDLVPDMIYVKDWYGRYLLANKATADALGTTVEALTAPGDIDMNADVTTPDEVLREERLLIDSELSSVIRAIPFMDGEGKRRILRTVKIPCTAFGKRKPALLCVATDITEQKHTEDILRSQNRILSELARGTDPAKVMTDLVNAAEEIVTGMRCSILLVSPDSRHLVHGVAPSLPAFYNEAVEGLSIGPGIGSCGESAHTGERVVAEDVTQHPNWAPYRDLAAKARIRACWSQPIKATTGETLGTFAMYYSEPRAPEPYEEDLIESMAHLAGIAIERDRLESRS